MRADKIPWIITFLLLLFSASLADPISPVYILSRNPVGAFLASFIFFIPCVLTELAIYDWLIREKPLWYKFTASTVINLITFFPANVAMIFMFDFFGAFNPLLSFALLVGIVEFVVIVVEGIMLRWLFNLKMKKALKVSAIANAASFVFSFLNLIIIS